MNFEGKKIILRAIEEEDLTLLHKWSNDPQTQNIMGAIHLPSSIDFHKKWFNNLIEDKLNIRFAIDAPNIGLIGLSSIMKIDWKNSHAWHGVMLGNVDIRGKGFGYDAVMTTMKYAFDELNFNRLDGPNIYHFYNNTFFFSLLFSILIFHNKNQLILYYIQSLNHLIY